MIRKLCGCLVLMVGGMCLVAGMSESAVADGSTSNTAECYSAMVSACGDEECTDKNKDCVQKNQETSCSGC